MVHVCLCIKPLLLLLLLLLHFSTQDRLCHPHAHIQSAPPHLGGLQCCERL
jgi:hypothetical protein